MKTRLTILAFLISITLIAQQGINYKALIKDDLGNVVANGNINVRFTIIDDSGPTDVYQETHINVTTDANGIVVLNIGTGTPDLNLFADIDWSKTNSLKVEIDLDDDGNFEFMNTSQLMAVPYAMQAKSVDKETLKIDDLSDAKSDGDGSSLFIGVYAGDNDDGSANQNLGIGIYSLYDNTTGSSNTAIGNSTLFLNSTGTANTAIGNNSLRDNTTGSLNSAIGVNALANNIEGSFNTAIGLEALFFNSSGEYNTAIGNTSLYDNISGTNNTAIGYGSLGNTLGITNTAIGVYSGTSNTNGSLNVFIGPNTGSPTNANENHKLYIDNTETTTPLIYGEFDNDLIRINGTLDISNAYQLPTTDGTANQILQTDGSGSASWQTPEVSSGLEQVTELDSMEIAQTGWRLKNNNLNNKLSIGSGAVDLSTSFSNLDERYGAYGSSSFAAGRNSKASGPSSTAMGVGTVASGGSSTAMGFVTVASGGSSTAMGFVTVASGDSSTAMGVNTVASGDFSTAIGYNTTAFGQESFAAGKDTNATGNNSTALGNNTIALGVNSISMGLFTTTIAEASTVIGKYNKEDNDGLFMVGNGTGTAIADRHNAFIIKTDGKVGVNTTNPASLFEIRHEDGAPTSGNRTNAFSIRNNSNARSWQLYTASDGYLLLFNDGNYRGSFNEATGAYVQASDRRVKKDVTALENGTLNKVMQLNPVSYLMRDQTDSKRNHGLISQEVKEIFPSITHYVKESDLLTLSYTELIPILIKAIQEQQEIIEDQNVKINTQSSDKAETDKMVQALLERVEALENKQSN